MPRSKIVLFDIEATNLAANFGYVLCFGWKTLGGKGASAISIVDSKTFKSDCTNDKYVVSEAARILSDADVVVGHYSTRFDMPYLNTRLLAHGLPSIPPIPHIDTWKIAKYKLKLNSNRLASISAHFGLEDKTPLIGPQWIRAAAGHKPSIKYVVDHCLQDVEVLEQTYLKIRELTTDHPNVALQHAVFKQEKAEGVRDCPICGTEGSLTKHKKRLCRVGYRWQYQCKHCRGYSCGPLVRAIGTSIT